MRRKILAVAHSYYMLLTVIQIRTTVYQDADFDIIISDASNNSEKVFEQLQQSNLFDHVYYYKGEDVEWKKQSHKSTKLHKFSGGLITPVKVVTKAGVQITNQQYDTMLIYVADRFGEQVFFNALKKNNQDLKCELYEEGFISYYSLWGILDNTRYVRMLPFFMKMFGKGRYLLSKNITKLWVFHPDLIQYKHSCSVGKIPPFNPEKRELIRKLDNIFGYPDGYKISEKYIFLEGCAYTDGYEIDDMYLLNHIAETVGKENILVKLHPRTRNNRFEKEGYKTFLYNMPLELFLMNGNQENKIFISLESGSGVSCLLHFNNENRMVLLYKASQYDDYLSKSMENEQFQIYLEGVQRNCRSGQLIIPETVEDIVPMMMDDSGLCRK